MASIPRAPLVCLAAALVAASCGATTPPPTPRIAGAGETPATDASAEPRRPDPSLPDLVDIGTAGAIPIDATYAVDRVVLAGGKAWVAGMGDGIGVVDARAGLTRSVPVEGACG